MTDPKDPKTKRRVEVTAISRTRAGANNDVPPFVSLRGMSMGTEPGFLGIAHRPFTAEGPGQPWAGRSYSMWQPATGQWRQTWVDDSGSYLAFTGGLDAPSVFVFRGIVPWCKTNPRRAMGRLWQEAEFVAWGSKGAMSMDRDASSGPGRLVGDPLPSFWLEGSPREREHMTEKPPGVMADLDRQCVRGGVILDPFAGSGATGVSATPEGRRFIGIETSLAYYEIACRRLAETEAGADRGSLKVGQASLFGGAP